VNIWLITMCQI